MALWLRERIEVLLFSAPLACRGVAVGEDGREEWGFCGPVTAGKLCGLCVLSARNGFFPGYLPVSVRMMSAAMAIKLKAKITR